MENKFNEQSNLFDGGRQICPCGGFIVNGVCDKGELCPNWKIYERGYRIPNKQEKFPIIEIEE